MSIGPQRPEALIGQVIADYELTAYIGTGATGLVFRGKRVAGAPGRVEKTGTDQITFPEDAAIKLLAPPVGATHDELEDFQRRFTREALILKQLDHPHILRVIDFGEDADSGYSYMILPYMAGGSLADVIAKRGPLPLAEIALILMQIASALDTAHAQGVVHRDVKPGNILLDADGAPYLSDFGIVRLLSDTATQRTTTGRLMGTPAYMAPEQFDDSSKVGPAADLYGLGMVVYEMVTGRAAFSATSWAQVMKRQLQETPVLPHITRPDLPEPAEAAILRALEKEPAERFATAKAFAQAFALGVQGQWDNGLTRFVAPANRSSTSEAAAQTLPDGLNARQARDARRRSRLGLLGAAVALLLVVGCVTALASGVLSLGALAHRGSQPTGTTANQQMTSSAISTVSPTGSHTPGANPTSTTKKGATSTPLKNGGPTATTAIGIVSPSPSGSPPSPTPDPTATLPDLIISTNSAQSTDGQSHGSGNPYTFTGNHSYGNVTIQSGAWATAVSHCTGGGSGVVQFSATGTVTIAGTLTVDAQGYCGGNAIQGAGGGMQGQSYSGSSQKQSSANYGGGGGGDTADSGGGGGGYGTSGQSSYNSAGVYDTSVYGGQTYGDSSLSTLFLGSGGGSSGAQSGSQGASGGNGGGAISITGATVTVSGTISADGGNGASVPNTPNNYRGGGGGSGGSIYLAANTITITGTIRANGGNGGYGIWDNTRNISGGNGGDGRIRKVNT